MITSNAKCYNCGGVKEDVSKACCNLCRKKNSISASNSKKSARETRILEGLCVKCGGVRDNKTQSCNKCRDKFNQYQRGRLEKLSPGKRVRIRELNKTLREERVALGVCLTCGGELVGKVKTCLTCTIKNHTRKATGTTSHWEKIKLKLEEQNFKCFYTGEDLQIGLNASIDHIIPRSSSKYPGDENLDNLVWATRDINRIKNDMAVDRFIALCTSVATNFPLVFEELKEPVEKEALAC